MGVAAEIFKDVVRTCYGFLNADYPLVAIEFVFELLESLRSFIRGTDAGEG